jgi:hypothetical protein
MKNKLYKDILLILIMGCIYYRLELLYDGKSSWWMILVGGICCSLIGRLNEEVAKLYPTDYYMGYNPNAMIDYVERDFGIKIEM